MGTGSESQTLSNPQNFAEGEENEPQTLIQRENEQDQRRQSAVQNEDQTLVQDPTAEFDTIYGFDGDDLFSSDEAFASFPDFHCLSSPSSSPSRTSATHPLKSIPTSTPSSSFSSYCSTSSNWPFLGTPDALPRSLPASSSEMSLQPQPSIPDLSAEAKTQPDMNLPGSGVDGFDFSVPWDPAELLPLMLDESGACSDLSFTLDQLCPRFDEMNNNDGAVGEEKEESDDTSKFFLEWLKNNKDVISSEDLCSVRLKKSTIECAARRLGSDRRGRMQLLKLILSWLQNHHLQGKKARLQEASQSHATAWINPTPAFNQVPIDSVPNANPNLNSDFAMGQATNRCNSWLMTTDPYSIPSSTNNSVAVNSQLYSPVSELHATDPNMSWDQSYDPSFRRGYPMTYQAGLQTTQYSVAPIASLYHQGQSITSMATKEARRKRMARQRRMLSFQQNRGLGLSDNPEQCT